MNSRSLSILFALLATATIAYAQDGPIRVNGVTIPPQRMEFFVRNLVAQGRPDTPELRNAVRQDLIDRFPINIPHAGRFGACPDQVDQTVKQSIAVVDIPADISIEFGNDLFAFYFRGSTTRRGGWSPIAKRYR